MNCRKVSDNAGNLRQGGRFHALAVDVTVRLESQSLTSRRGRCDIIKTAIEHGQALGGAAHQHWGAAAGECGQQLKLKR
ncbi:hypothetical protein LAD67_08470 [Escherichia coli]|nr:hypothetical protein [Escherichia coli]